jgi:hypothetical protein
MEVFLATEFPTQTTTFLYLLFQNVYSAVEKVGEDLDMS